MSDKQKDFHNVALKSSLFKGRGDLYFCFLKSERITHVLSVLLETTPGHVHSLASLVEAAGEVPSSIVHLAAGELEVSQVLAEIFSILAAIRLQVTSNVLAQDAARILISEYETLVEKLDAGTRLSPFMTPDDFLIQPFVGKLDTRSSVADELAKKTLAGLGEEVIKDKSKGQNASLPAAAKHHVSRMDTILQLVRDRKRVSIKDISSVITNCSEKTIQRELVELVRKGLIRRVGERRWSHYEPS